MKYLLYGVEFICVLLAIAEIVQKQYIGVPVLVLIVLFIYYFMDKRKKRTTHHDK